MQAIAKRKLTEILVFADDDPCLGNGQSDDLAIRRSWANQNGRSHVVAGRAQGICNQR